MRIGLTQNVVVLKDRNERRDCLDQAWTSLLIERGYLPIPLPNCVEDVDALVAELELSGVILTGGNDLSSIPDAATAAPERDRFETELLNVTAKRNLPVLGVCRGMHMMVYHYGGELHRVERHVARDHPVSILSPFAYWLGPREHVNSYHNFGVLKKNLGPNLLVAALAEDRTVEAVCHAHLKQFAVMWHPERQPKESRDSSLFDAVFKR